jgi:hypothetical protein
MCHTFKADYSACTSAFFNLYTVCDTIFKRILSFYIMGATPSYMITEILWKGLLSFPSFIADSTHYVFILMMPMVAAVIIEGSVNCVCALC